MTARDSYRVEAQHFTKQVIWRLSGVIKPAYTALHKKMFKGDLILSKDLFQPPGQGFIKHPGGAAAHHHAHVAGGQLPAFGPLQGIGQGGGEGVRIDGV